MNRYFSTALAAAAMAVAAVGGAASDLVILHTNDTHSLIDPDANGEGGVLQRKALIDSVRAAEKNVLLVDAGDVVQGTLYFKFFKGDVEYPLMNMMGYDVQILGNHEFDNGLDELARYYRTLKADRLSANYDFSGTAAEGLFIPSTIREYDGHRVGILGINIDPSSLISSSNYEGMKFLPVSETANAVAADLKRQGCDMVIAVTHIGAMRDNDKEIDYDLAAASKDIDLIIGGHSHTLIRPHNGTPEAPSIVRNAEGRPVMVAQTGKYGRYLGYIKIDLDKLDSATPADFDQRLIHVTDRFPAETLDAEMAAFIEPFRRQLEAVDRHVIGRADVAMPNGLRTGAYANWSGDVATSFGTHAADSLRAAGMELRPVDFGMMNVGGIRHAMPEGDVTEGEILATFPFANHFVLVDIKGADFIDAMRIAATKGGEAISDEIRVLTDGDGNLTRVLLNGVEMDPEQHYTMSTIDYLAWGNDDFTPLAKGEIVWRDDAEVSLRILEHIAAETRKGMPLGADPRSRFLKEVVIENTAD